MDHARRTAYLTLMDIEKNKAYSNLALNHHIAVAKPDSKAFVRRLVYGVLENRIFLDYIIQHYLTDPSHKLDASDRTVLRMGLYQLAFMDSIPPYAAVTETVNLAKRYCKGREGFVNAILRNYLRTKDKISLPDRETDEIAYLSVKYSYAPWIVKMWLAEYGSQFTEELLAEGNKTPELVIRPNLLKNSRKELKRRLENHGYEVHDGRMSHIALRVKGEGLLDTFLYKSGMFSVQDESSMVVVDVLDPKPNEFIIDVCAAPGGKTMYIAERMENRGRIIARDLYKKKLDLLRKDADRLGISIIETGTWDASKTDSALAEQADRVLVDAPCSGLGIVRRKPEIKYKEWEGELESLPELQMRILNASSKYVKPGGVLLYSTCTINTAENQDITKAFLKENKQFIMEESIQLFPNITDTDGFYICRMRRR
ncbi:MAG: 16S rRNA (cytosine(967)-C(5))-methyltransferase RsmB [Anaerovoracaceae bacterium]|jgi:16S rRNA (cytosine967-C5)-methyltransferase